MKHKKPIRLDPEHIGEPTFDPCLTCRVVKPRFGLGKNKIKIVQFDVSILKSVLFVFCTTQSIVRFFLIDND